MGYDELKDKFFTIGYHTPSPLKPDKLGRLRIGTYGIGFLAPLPYCEKMTVVTKKREQTELSKQP